MAQGYNRDDLLIAEFKEAFNEFDKVRNVINVEVKSFKFTKN